MKSTLILFTHLNSLSTHLEHQRWDPNPPLRRDSPSSLVCIISNHLVNSPGTRKDVCKEEHSTKHVFCLTHTHTQTHTQTHTHLVSIRSFGCQYSYVIFSTSSSSLLLLSSVHWLQHLYHLSYKVTEIDFVPTENILVLLSLSAKNRKHYIKQRK